MPSLGVRAQAQIGNGAVQGWIWAAGDSQEFYKLQIRPAQHSVLENSLHGLKFILSIFRVLKISNSHRTEGENALTKIGTKAVMSGAFQHCCELGK